MENPESPDRNPSAPSLKLILGLSSIVLLITLCLASGVCLTYLYIRQTVRATAWTLPLMDDTPPLLNQIAFMGNDNNLWLVAPDGSDLRPVTQDGRGYRFPTWAPDSRHLAFIGPGEGATALFLSSAGGNKPEIIYDRSGSPPFYLYWAPDSRSLAFLTQEKSSLALRLVDVRMPETQWLIGEGSPFYWAWSPQGDRMIVHVGGSRDLSAEAHISILEKRQEPQQRQLNPAPGRFQAPAWSSDGQYLFYIAGNEAGTDSIYRAQADTLEEKLILNLIGFAHITLSPDDQNLAYLQYERGTRPPFGRAYLLNIESQEDKLLTEDLVASMYWSPDGRKLALLSLNLGPTGPTASRVDGLAFPLPQQAVLRWWVYHLEDETLEPLFSFSPTTAFLQTVPYFDQYHLSLTFWSPDSRYFVVTRREDKDGNGSVWVVDTTGEEESRKIAEGTMAVWSWQ